MGRRQGHAQHDRRAERQDRRVPGQGRAAGLRPLAGPPLPHQRHARDRDLERLERARLHRHVRGLRRRALPVLAGRRLRRARGRHRERGDLHRAGRVLGRVLPPADQVRASTSTGRTSRWSAIRSPTRSSTSSSASSRASCPTATTTRRTTTSTSTASATTASSSASGSSDEAYEGSDETMRLAQKRLRDNDLTTFVGSDHGFAPQFLAIDASKVLVDLGLLSLPQISNCRASEHAGADPRAPRRSARPRRATRAAPCRST